MNLLNNLNLTRKLTAAFAIVGIIPLLCIVWVAVQNSTDSLHKATFKKVLSIREVKKLQIEELVSNIRKQSTTLASSTMIVDAMKEFDKAYRVYNTELGVNSVDSMRTALWSYWDSDFTDTYKSKNSNQTPPDLKSKFAKLDKTSIALQHAYIKANRHPLGSKHLLDMANDGTSYANAHRKYHPSIRKYLETFGYYDIFLVEPKGGHIVYSVFKELDYTTSLLNGPFADTNFGQVFRNAVSSNDSNFVTMVDLKPYFPSYEYPAGFVASPIVDQGKTLGVLIMQVPVEQIDKVMTNNQRWQDIGLGLSGQTYLVGSDYTLRSNPRQLIENPDVYTTSLEVSGTASDVIADISAKGTAVLKQVIKTEATEISLKQESGESIYKDYRGADVLGAYTPLELPDLQWVLLSEVDDKESLQPVLALWKQVTIWSAVILSLTLFFGVIVARSMSRPLIGIMNTLDKGADNSHHTSSKLKEIADEVASSSTEQACAVQESVASMAQVSTMIAQASENARSSLDLAQNVRESTDQGGRIMESMVSSMESIQQANLQLQEMANIIEQISVKTGVINDIVFKTQLLAFNASIEAARAGQHGRGFAVVAEEVGHLAEMSGKAATEIQALLDDSKSQVNSIVANTEKRVSEGQSVSKQALETFNEISQEVYSISSQVQSINDTALEQEQGVGQTTKAMSDMDSISQQNNSTAQKAAQYADQMTLQSEELSKVVASLRNIIFGGQEDHKYSDRFSGEKKPTEVIESQTAHNSEVDLKSFVENFESRHTELSTDDENLHH